jgi:hypothetical protein
MARKAQKMMNEDDSSCIYALVSFSSAIPYIGLVEKRPAAERLAEHYPELY